MTVGGFAGQSPWPTAYEVIDISQPVSRETACFPGDVPYSHTVTVSYPDSGVLNLCAFTMSPHVGTHADAPVHVRGNLSDRTETVSALPLDAFIGPALVVDVSPWTAEISCSQVEPLLSAWPVLPPRILFKTVPRVRPTLFEPPYAWLSVSLIEALARGGVRLVGLDTPSVDAVDSKTLDSHHALLAAGMVWLENLDLGAVPLDGPVCAEFFLSALPMRLTELEAAPVRAVLLAPR